MLLPCHHQTSLSPHLVHSYPGICWKVCSHLDCSEFICLRHSMHGDTLYIHLFVSYSRPTSHSTGKAEPHTEHTIPILFVICIRPLFKAEFLCAPSSIPADTSTGLFSTPGRRCQDIDNNVELRVCPGSFRRLKTK